MNQRIQSNLPGAAVIVIAMTAFLLLPWLGETLFNSKGEPREAIVAVSMLKYGDWILPQNFGGDIPFKPPFMAWIIAGLAWLFNGGEVNEYLSRLPSALAAVAMVAGGYFWAKKARGTRFAMIFSFVTITSVEVFRAAWACRLDMVLTACMVGAIYVLYDLTERQGRFRALRWLAAVALLTCATLTKGPVGALLPCFVIGVYRLLRHRRFFPTLGAMLLLVVASLAVPALWYYAAYLRGGDGFLDLMLEENIGRLTGNMSYESHVNPWYYNFITLAAGLCPWTLLMLFCLFGLKRFLREPRTPLTPAALLSLTAAVIIVGFYCIPASKRSVYLLPAYPFICYGIASAMDSLAAVRPVKVYTYIISVLAILAPAAVIALQIHPMPGVLPMESIPWWRYAALLLPVAAGIAWFVNRHSPVGHVLVTVWALYLAYSVAAMPAILNAKSDKAVVPQLAGAPAVLVMDDMLRPYTLNFYLDDRIRPVRDWDAIASYPAGTLVLLTEDYAKSAPEGYRVDELRRKSCDSRRPLYMATKKQ